VGRVLPVPLHKVPPDCVLLCATHTSNIGYLSLFCSLSLNARSRVENRTLYIQNKPHQHSKSSFIRRLFSRGVQAGHRRSADHTPQRISRRPSASRSGALAWVELPGSPLPSSGSRAQVAKTGLIVETLCDGIGGASSLFASSPHTQQQQQYRSSKPSGTSGLQHNIVAV
jgi:hypothetical protein